VSYQSSDGCFSESKIVGNDREAVAKDVRRDVRKSCIFEQLLPEFRKSDEWLPFHRSLEHKALNLVGN
jgi:hypothetical protein